MDGVGHLDPLSLTPFRPLRKGSRLTPQVPPFPQHRASEAGGSSQHPFNAEGVLFLASAHLVLGSPGSLCLQDLPGCLPASPPSGITSLWSSAEVELSQLLSFPPGRGGSICRVERASEDSTSSMIEGKMASEVCGAGNSEGWLWGRLGQAL